MRILFWVYKSRLNKAGKAPIMMRITYRASRLSFSIGLFIQPKQWNKSKQRVKGSNPTVREMNASLMNLHNRAWNYYNNCLSRNVAIHLQEIRNAVLGENIATTTLLEAFTYQLSNLRARVGFDVAINTVKKYETAERKIKSFLKQKFNQGDISLQEVSHRFILDFDLFMRTKETLKHNAIIKNMQQLRRVITICLKNEWLDKNPFTGYSFKLDETERGYLSAQELQVMESIPLPSTRLQQVRDVFIFCCYTGLSYADVSKLNSAHIHQENGIAWIKIARSKTQNRSTIPLLPQAQSILDGYSTMMKDRKLLPVISNQNLNKYLKEIASLCGISKRVSMHLARHTFATTVTLGNGVDIASVSKMLGHKSIKTTQVYAKVTELKILKDVAHLLDENKKAE